METNIDQEKTALGVEHTAGRFGRCANMGNKMLTNTTTCVDRGQREAA
jgi:hypothetical protein